MKKLFLIFSISIISSFKILACSSIPESFCSTLKSVHYNEDLVVYGKIISIDNNGINFEIIDVLRGQETRNTIRIWDGVDFDCNGIFSMSASEIGKINETLIIILPKITEKKSDWEVIGDYRRPNYFGVTTSLNVKNGIVSGFIYGISFFPFNNHETNYENFKNWIANPNCSSLKLSSKSFELEKTINILNLSNNKLKISSDTNNKHVINIFNVSGQKIESELFFIRETEIDLSKYPSGIYFIHLTSENYKYKVRKVIKI